MSKILTFGGYALTVGNHAVGAEIYQIPLPANTLRLKFTEGVTPSFSKGTATQVSQSPNIWDLTYNNSNWSSLLYFQSDLIEVIGAGDTSSVTNMNGMFQGCTSLISVVIFDTSNVTNMNSMFASCRNITSIPFFNTSNVTKMDSTFSHCEKISSIPQFNTDKVTIMHSMFNTCKLLTSIPTYNTENVTDMSSMLSECSKLKAIPLFNTAKVTDISWMCYGCFDVEHGALDLYTQASTQVNPPSSHSYTFTNCGRDTVTGSAELAQIPSDWK